MPAVFQALWLPTHNLNCKDFWHPQQLFALCEPSGSWPETIAADVEVRLTHHRYKNRADYIHAMDLAGEHRCSFDCLLEGASQLLTLGSGRGQSFLDVVKAMKGHQQAFHSQSDHGVETRRRCRQWD